MDSESPIAFGPTGQVSDVAESHRFGFRAGTGKTEFDDGRVDDRPASGLPWSSPDRRTAEGHGR